ncbi:uncharacterized protein [Aegilops tauschii subsp. strangulata]|uniref:Uncharacterized protein n=1 Tax=Aegilops tauschii subsp. strangulata TaxID=200361 RepID=A0A453GBE1_AEGTS|nr:uncharacterized protein LOC109742795 [Aegilops tauschii subsp. strangulata]XP_044359134.1 uncharacterized protein LOC123080286 [Triticum aestivum]
MGPAPGDSKRFSGVVPPAALVFLALVFVAGAIVTLHHKESLSILQVQPRELAANEESSFRSAPPVSDLRVASDDVAETPSVEQATPPVEQTTTPVEQTTPPVEQATTSVEQTTPPVEEAPDICENQCRPPGSEALPRGIVQDKSNFEFESLGGNPGRKGAAAGRPAKSLLAIPVGIKQKAVVDKLVSKFPAANFAVMLFHYDGAVDGWGDLPWSRRAVHVAAVDQTKWWFGKRFLHPDLVADYDYIFLWDEDIEVDGFDPMRYLRIVRKEGLEISQPALDHRSQIHHRLTARARRGGTVHRRFYKTAGGGRCYGNSTGPPCTGWVEMMVPVFSRAAWRCAWRMIQNDLVFAWGLDFKLGYCAQGDRSSNVGIVDSEYVLHRGIPTLGDGGGKGPAPKAKASSATSADRYAVRLRSYKELQIFNKRWNEAVAEDMCWTDPYPQPPTATPKG